jgi:hypothetical protein
MNTYDSVAVLWAGTAGSARNIHPAALLGSRSFSVAIGISGNQHGFGEKTSMLVSVNDYALLWTGTADSAVDLCTRAHCWEPTRSPEPMRPSAASMSATAPAGTSDPIHPDAMFTP